MKKYPVVSLCGSTRFKSEFEQVQKKLTLKGYIVISVGLFGHSGDEEVWDGVDEDTKTCTKMMLDDMHKKKIDMADSIFVVNPGGYIGESTWSEICYAKMIDKGIETLEFLPEREIEVMVHRHIETAERLAWEQLDGIRHSDGYYNLDDYVQLRHKGKIIVDPWINLETHYNGSPWPDHANPEEGVNPFAYYGKQKTAAFIEEIIMRRG